MKPDQWDVIIVGGGAAGLSAALVLGRCRRSVRLFDDGKPRNAKSHSLHGFLGHDGLSPATLRHRALEQLVPYPSVVIDNTRVLDARSTPAGFVVETIDSRQFSARKLVLATGVVDELPEIPGFCELYGAGIFHCPYCDGWEVRDQALAVYGQGDDKGGGLALEMTQWSRDVVLCSDGPSGLSADYRARLRRHHRNTWAFHFRCVSLPTTSRPIGIPTHRLSNRTITSFRLSIKRVLPCRPST